MVKFRDALVGYLAGFFFSVSLTVLGLLRSIEPFSLNELKIGMTTSRTLALSNLSLPASEAPVINDTSPQVKEMTWVQVGSAEFRALVEKQLFIEEEAVYRRNIARREQRFQTIPTKSVFDALYYYTPNYVCKEERVGVWHDGGKWMCDPQGFNASSVVYSVGSNGDVSFETDLHSICNGCQIHTFDMTLSGWKVKAVRQAEFEKVLTFHNYGLSSEDVPEKRLKSLKSIMRSLGHTHIDFFKIDCEGCEWKFFDDLFKDWTPGLISQISVELHYYYKLGRTNKLLKKLEELGYRIFRYELNYRRPATHIEISFVHESIAGRKLRH